MKLRELLAKIDLLPDEHLALDRKVTGISTNSHACRPGDLFVGMPGTRVDGGEFWQSAIDSGAIAAIITPKLPPNSHRLPMLASFKPKIPSLLLARSLLLFMTIPPRN